MQHSRKRRKKLMMRCLKPMPLLESEQNSGCGCENILFACVETDQFSWMTTEDLIVPALFSLLYMLFMFTPTTHMLQQQNWSHYSGGKPSHPLICGGGGQAPKPPSVTIIMERQIQQGRSLTTRLMRSNGNKIVYVSSRKQTECPHTLAALYM